MQLIIGESSLGSLREQRAPQRRKVNLLPSNMRIVTTSWDDGDPNDVKIADLCAAGTSREHFMSSIVGYRGRKTLATSDLRALFWKVLKSVATVFHKSLSNLSRNRSRTKYETANRYWSKHWARKWAYSVIQMVVTMRK